MGKYDYFMDIDFWIYKPASFLLVHGHEDLIPKIEGESASIYCGWLLKCVIFEKSPKLVYISGFVYKNNPWYLNIRHYSHRTVWYLAHIHSKQETGPSVFFSIQMFTHSHLCVAMNRATDSSNLKINQRSFSNHLPKGKGFIIWMKKFANWLYKSI